MNNLQNLSKLKATHFKIAYHFDKPIDDAGYISALLHTSFESIYKKIDIQLSKQGLSNQSFFRSHLTKEQIKLHPKLKDYAHPPRGYAFSFTVDVNSSLLVIELNLFGKFSDVLPHLLPFLPLLFSQKTLPKMTFAYIIDGYGRTFDTIDKLRGVPPAVFSLDYFQQAKLRSNTLKILFQSPLMLRNDHNQVGTVTFYDLLGAIVRRASMLSFVYADADVPDFDTFYIPETKNINIESVQLRWNKWDIPVKEGKSEFSIAGYTGMLRYHGDKHVNLLQDYLPLLLFCQYVQAGDKTNYGGGKYMISNECYTFI